MRSIEEAADRVDETASGSVQKKAKDRRGKPSVGTTKTWVLSCRKSGENDGWGKVSEKFVVVVFGGGGGWRGNRNVGCCLGFIGFCWFVLCCWFEFSLLHSFTQVEIHNLVEESPTEMGMKFQWKESPRITIWACLSSNDPRDESHVIPKFKPRSLNPAWVTFL